MADDMVDVYEDKAVRVAFTRTVQREMDRVSHQRANVAISKLAAHRYEGHSRIEVESNDVDRIVTLDDTRGLLAALTIETGRNASERDKGMKGLFILHDSFDIPH